MHPYAFTLKVIDDKSSGYLVSDTLHPLGGIDILQSVAFNHLFPDGACDWMLRQTLYDMAELHGWGVSVRTRETKSQT